VVIGVEGRRQVEADRYSNLLVVVKASSRTSVVQSPWNVLSCMQTGIG